MTTAPQTGAHQIYIHKDHDFKANPGTVYYTDVKVTGTTTTSRVELGTFGFNQPAWSSGIHGQGNGECKFSNHAFDCECPYSAVYYYGAKPTPGTTIGPEYRFGDHTKERVFYRTDVKTGNPVKLGAIVEYGAAYDAGFNGVSTGYSMFELDKTTFETCDCREILPVKYKVYYHLE